MSIGAKSLESDENVDFAERQEVVYECPSGHRTIVPFAVGAEFPETWECHCGLIARREDANGALVDGLEDNKPQRTHWDMLLERRSEEELKELLEKRLKMHAEGWFPEYE
jgi:hypothetical protein